MIDQATVMKKKVIYDLDIALGIKKKVMVWPTVTGRSKSNCLYNLSWLRLVYYDWTKARPFVLGKKNYMGDM